MLTHPAGCRPTVRNRPFITRVARDRVRPPHSTGARGEPRAVLELRMRQWLVFLSLFLLLGTPLHTAAQTAAPSPVSGQVTDPSGAPIAGASITVASNGQPVGAPAATDARGGFELTLPPGKYSLTVAA